MKLSSLSTVPLFASLAACASNVRLIESIPAGWQRMGAAANPNQQFRVSFGLQQDKMQDLHDAVTSGKTLSRDQASAMRAPTPGALDNILGWLDGFSLLNDTTTDNEWVHLDTTVAKVQHLLNTTLFHFAFEDDDPVLRATSFMLPANVTKDVSVVHPLTNFMTKKQKRQAAAARPNPDAQAAQSKAAGSGAVCQAEVTPACLKTLYNITSVAEGNSSVMLAVAGFLEENADRGDLRSFLSQYAPDVNSNFRVELINNGTNPQDNPGTEANLDMQYAKSIGPDGDIVFMSAGGRGVFLDENGNPVNGSKNTNEPYLEFLQYLLDKPDGQLPHVLSISYGDDELSVPKDYAVKVCDYLGLLTARGVSVVVSSGDSGAGAGGCFTHDSAKREVTMGAFPATCPWVTSVGATTNNQEPPVAATFSSGGFSQYFPRPSWQDGVVDDYIKSLNGHLEGKYNGSMRAFPDVAAVGTSFVITWNGTNHLIGGTSASAPTFAAMIALIVDIRLRQGKGPLGWLNKYLYSKSVRSVLQDVTLGSTTPCSWETTSPGGWPAAPGWDAATGLGVPKDWYALMQALLVV